MAHSLQLPPDAQERVAARLERASDDLFMALDEVQEHGGTYVSVTLARPGHPAARIRVLIASVDVEIRHG